MRSLETTMTHPLLDHELAKLMPCGRAILMASEMNIHKLSLETNNRNVAAKLSVVELDKSAYEPLVKEMKSELHII